MTPGIADNRVASVGGSAMCCNWASTSQCPPSVTKAWPFCALRSGAGPGQLLWAALFSIARRVAAAPNGAISTGSGKRPSVCTHFELVSDHDHLGRGCGHDLLAQQRPTAALDQAQIGRDLIGAVNSEVKFGSLIEGGQRDPRPFGLRAGCFRGRHRGYFEPGANTLAQQFNQIAGGRTGAEPKPHAGTHEGQRSLGGGALLLLYVHWHREETLQATGDLRGN